MHHSVLEVKKIVGLSISKLSFKVASAYILQQSNDICLQKLNKTPGAQKSARPIRSNIANTVRHVRPKIVISAAVKNDWLCHLAIFFHT